MLAGEPPFTAPTLQALIVKRLSAPAPNVRHTRPGIPEGLEQAITRALATVAADRFVSAGEFARAVQTTTAMAAAIPISGSTASNGGGRRRLPLAATALGLGILIGLGVLFAWRRTNMRTAEHGGVKVLAVLPFENLGDSSQAYFADGIGDEVRGKLSQLTGLAVIARASSNEYRRTNTPLPQIARDLGAEYLLTATVRWEKHPDGTSRVRVSPELVRVTPGAAPTTQWQHGFDAALTDVFQVQADISGKVAEELKLALGDSTKRDLAERPTQSLAAYDAFLRGQAALQSDNPGSARAAAAALEQAVALDSNFLEAWAQLGEAQFRLHSETPTPATAEAVRHAAERAVAIDPARPEGHLVLSKYFYNVVWNDARGFTEDSIALALAPMNPVALKAMGWDEIVLGRWEPARRHLERAVRLDPRSDYGARGLAYILLYARQYRAAARDLDSLIQRKPTDLGFRQMRTIVALAQGDLPRARAILAGVPQASTPATVVAQVAMQNEQLWVLDSVQRDLLLRLRPSAFEDDRASWGLALAEGWTLRGDRAKARVYADSARLAFEQQLQVSPNDPERRALLGLALAYLGQKGAAIRQGERGVALMPLTRDAFVGPTLQHQLARIYLLVGEPEKALDQLEHLLKIPYYLSPGWLKIDPNFAPLQGNPRFERLVNGQKGGPR
jgi:TolB-like protein/Flp pilus assembly protein TadD